MMDNQMINQETAEQKTEIHLRKKDLMKSWIIWELTSEMCLNYERLMALGFCHAMTPIIKRLYPNKEERAEALTRHMAFFNTENNWGALIPGMVASLEEEKANGVDISSDMINGIKTGLMGPIAGIGDTITQGLVKTILLAIGIGMAQKGSVAGPLVFFLLYTAYILATGYFTYFQGYKFGKNAFSKIKDSSIMRRITDCMCIIGLTVAGSLVASTLSIQTPFVLKMGGTAVKFQELFDQILPGFLGVAVTALVFFGLKKNVSVIKIMITMTIAGIILVALGLL